MRDGGSAPAGGLGLRGFAAQQSRSRVLAGGAPARGGESEAVGAGEQQPSPAVCWRKAERCVELLQASRAGALDALSNTYIKRVIISKSVSYANEQQLHLEEHPTV